MGNFPLRYQQFDQYLFRGANPRGRIRVLWSDGIKRILDLESGIFDLTHGNFFAEAQEAQKYDIPVYHVPLSDFCAPNKAQVAEVLQLARKAISLRQAMYIHCWKGVDRTGFMVAAIRVSIQGWTVDKALCEMFEMGFHRCPYFTWERTFTEMFASGACRI